MSNPTFCPCAECGGELWTADEQFGTRDRVLCELCVKAEDLTDEMAPGAELVTPRFRRRYRDGCLGRAA